MDLYMVYITFPDIDSAEKAASILLEEKLVACANILRGCISMYWWEGKIQRDDEVVLLAKTTGHNVERVEERVKRSHSYSCPCITAFQCSHGSSEFAEWVKTSTS